MSFSSQLHDSKMGFQVIWYKIYTALQENLVDLIFRLVLSKSLFAHKSSESPTNKPNSAHFTTLCTTDKDKQDPRSKPAFTQPDGGVAEYGGWSKAGRKRYRALLAAIKNSKGDPNAKSGSKGKKQFDYVKALETEALKALQVAKQVNVSGRAAKRNPALNKDDEVDSDHEVDWS